MAATRTRPAASATWLGDRRAARWLRAAAYAYAVAWGVHTGDHLRRGLGVITVEVSVLGSVAAVLQLVAVGAVLRRAAWAPMAAVAVGFPDALGIAAVHLLPRWSSLSDAFPGAHGSGVTGFSWFAAILEILAALAFGLAGAYAWWRNPADRRPALSAGQSAATGCGGAPARSTARSRASPGYSRRNRRSV